MLNARRRGKLDVAMIGLMRDARLRVYEAAALTWGDVERVPGGSGRVRVEASGETSYRVVSADTMKLLSSVRRNAGDNEPLLGMRPNQIAIRIGSAARQAGLGEGYSGESPRLGMIQDLETLGVLLLGPPCCRPSCPAAHFCPKGTAWRLTGAAARRRTPFQRFSLTTILTVIPAPCIRFCYTDVIVSIAIANTALGCKAFGQLGPGPG